VAVTLLMLLGLGLQLGGIVVTATGLWRTWREHAGGNARLRDELVKPYQIALQRAETLLRKLMRRPARRTVEVSAAGTALATGRATVTRGWAALPKTWRASHALIDQRLNELRRELDEIDARVADVKDEAQGIAAQVSETERRLEEQDKAMAVSGIPLAVHGLIYVGAGIGVQILAELVR
jgi:hypothetical protein